MKQNRWEILQILHPKPNPESREFLLKPRKSRRIDTLASAASPGRKGCTACSLAPRSFFELQTRTPNSETKHPKQPSVRFAAAAAPVTTTNATTTTHAVTVTTKICGIYNHPIVNLPVTLVVGTFKQLLFSPTIAALPNPETLRL